MEKLCKCLNCDTIYIDENPQIGAIEHDVTFEVKSMEWLKDEDDYYWGCPECQTDSYLVDL